MLELIIVAALVVAAIGHKMAWWTIPGLNSIPGMSNTPDDE